MSRCKYRYYVTSLPCKQFHLRGGTEGRGHSSHRGPWPPLRTALTTTTNNNAFVERHNAVAPEALAEQVAISNVEQMSF